MGCASAKAVKQENVPHIRRRLSVGEVHHAPNGEEEVEVSAGDRSLMMTLTQSQILDFIKTDEVAGRKYSISSETDTEGRLARSFSDKAVKLQGAEFDVHQEGIGYVCKKGLKPEAPNQDSFFIMKVEDSYSLYGVFDGHGSKGHDVSNFVKDNLPKILLSQDNLLQDPMKALAKTFEKTQYLIEKATQLKKIDATRSGTTCSVVLHDHRRRMLYIAHVGDSRVVLGKQDTNEHGKPSWKAVELTIDHKPDLQSERERIEKAGGIVLFDGGWNHRVYAKGKKDARGKRYPGLNMSRALGDLSGFYDAGISAEPDVKARVVEQGHAKAGTQPTTSTTDTAPIQKTSSNTSGENRRPSKGSSAPSVSSHAIDSSVDKLLILCSDGVWEFVSSDQAVSMVGQFPAAEATNAAEQLATVSWDRWMQELDGQVVDDITAVVIHLDDRHAARK